MFDVGEVVICIRSGADAPNPWHSANPLTIGAEYVVLRRVPCVHANGTRLDDMIAVDKSGRLWSHTQFRVLQVQPRQGRHGCFRMGGLHGGASGMVEACTARASREAGSRKARGRPDCEVRAAAARDPPGREGPSTPMAEPLMALKLAQQIGREFEHTFCGAKDRR